MNPVKQDRRSDSSPYYGGIPTWKHGQQPDTYCTTGFDVIGNRTGLTYSLIAGHCGLVNEAVDTNFVSNRTIGRITNRRFIDGGLDSATIGGTYRPYVWGASDSVYGVIGSGDVAPGQGSLSKVAVDGAVTGEQRNKTVTATDQCIYYPDFSMTTCYLSLVSADTEGGDSGGPVFQHDSRAFANVFAAGTIDGGAGPHTVAVTQIVDIEQFFNVQTATK